ncbi:MAG: hypothetical protein K1X78_09690 [Verrucomicrobiaceae bacterium]|nr:hypothetical protein [Verrucomicrobiaceae bacterium]
MTANGEAFLKWALDAERTVEEKFSILLLLEHCAREFYPGHWKTQAKRREARRYNAAWVPVLNPEAARVTAGKLEEVETYPVRSDDDRALRDFEILRFLPAVKGVNFGPDMADLEALRHVPGIEQLSVSGAVMDISGLRHVPGLKTLSVGGLRLEDYRPVALCRKLRTLHVQCSFPWPRIEGWEALVELEELCWQGSALGFLSVKRLPALRKMTLHCGLANGDGGLRDFAQLPEMPDLRLLDAHHFFYLEGIERYSKLINAVIAGPIVSAAPVAALPDLTHLVLRSDHLEEVRSLAECPALHALHLAGKRPQDFAPLAGAPQLRSVRVEGCETPQLDLDMLRVVLPDWDDYFARQEARPLRRLKQIVCEKGTGDPRWPRGEYPERTDDWQANPAFRREEHAWVARRLQAALDAQGMTRAEGCRVDSYHVPKPVPGKPPAPFQGGSGNGDRRISLWLLGPRMIGRLREIVECLRPALAGITHPWFVTIMGEPEADDEMWGRAWVNRDDDDSTFQFFQEKRRKEAELLAQELRMKLLREQGIEPDAKDFIIPPPPASDAGKGGVATKSKADDAGDAGDGQPPPMKFDAPNLDWNKRDGEDDAEGGIKDADPEDAEDEDEHWLPPPPKMDPNTFWRGLNLYVSLGEEALHFSPKGAEVVQYLMSLGTDGAAGD